MEPACKWREKGNLGPAGPEPRLKAAMEPACKWREKVTNLTRMTGL